MKTSSRRRSFASLIAAAAVLAGLFVAPIQSASALGCVLGPSLASAAKAAGVSCPDVEGGGGGSAAWGAAGGACAYGWQNGGLPPGMLEYLNGSAQYNNDYVADNGDHLSRSTYRRGGHTIGQIEFWSNRGVFVLAINLYGRAGLKHEFAYFDCMQSKDGAVYKAEPFANLVPMPTPGSTTVPPAVQGYVQTRGAMTALPDDKYLLRIDFTSTDTNRNFIDVALGLDGYSVESFPLLPRAVTCEPLEGLLCSVDGILPGQTVSLIVELAATGDVDAAAAVDVDVAAEGFVKTKVSTGSPRVNRKALVTNFYEVVRP